VPLPVEDVIPALRRALREQGAAVLQAPPGAGKTTAVPPALLEEPWLEQRRMVMLEPRRVAARAAASFMAPTLGGEVGGLVGYRTRLDTRVSAHTRIEVVTEGVLLRMLASDPGLLGYGLVIFDEFHERSLHGDASLVLTLEARAVLRPDLRLLVMSATLDGTRVAALLNQAPVITSTGTAHPVEMAYMPAPAGLRLEAQVAQAVLRALDEQRGDVLAFLPGTAEIRRTESALADRLGGQGHVVVIPLHGMLGAEQQDRALRPDASGRRKVVLATSIAETSLTIDGVRAVVDAGLARVPRFSARTGLTRLVTVRASRAATEQRAGRAGRQAPGVCYRLWRADEQAGLVPFAAPEILEADLAPVLLQFAAAGVLDSATLRWLDAPPAAHVAEARALLESLGLITPAGALTPHGSRSAALGLHPRLAHMVLAAADLGCQPTAIALAAVLEERDMLRAPAEMHDPDVRLRLELLHQRPVPPSWHGVPVLREVAERVLRHAGAIARQVGAPPDGRRVRADPELAGAAALLAWPDRLAMRRPGTPRFLLRSGRGAVLQPPHAMGDADFIVALDLDDRGVEGRVFLAAPVAPDEVERLAGARTTEDVIAIEADGVIRATRRERLGAIVLREVAAHDAPAAAVAQAVVAHEAGTGLRHFMANEGLARLRERLAFLRGLDASWPDVSDDAVLSLAAQWMPVHVPRLRRLDDLARADLAGMLLAVLDWRQRRALDLLAPTHVQLPRGRRAAIDYADPTAPVLAVRLQDLFGESTTPTVAGGRVPLTLHLLSPARRPVQVTRDLAGFWRGSYADVRKDMRGRYPKHDWPEEPWRRELREGRRDKREEGEK
jgi:ATP-dependent helicase HrpB